MYSGDMKTFVKKGNPVHAGSWACKSQDSIIQQTCRYDKDRVRIARIVTKPDLINARTKQRVTPPREEHRLYEA